MPTYQYACTECGEPLEVVQSFTDDSLTECPSCGGRLRKQFNAVGIVFKGSGFYRTDSRAGSTSSAGSSNGSSKANGEGKSSGSEKAAKSEGSSSSSSKDSSSSGSGGSGSKAKSTSGSGSTSAA